MSCCEHVGRGEKQEVRQAFGESRTGLRRHIRMEEQVLFPEFERSTGCGDCPTPDKTAVMQSRLSSFLRMLWNK
jgi:hypothetical protein